MRFLTNLFIVLLFSFDVVAETTIESLAKQLLNDDEMERNACYIVPDDQKEELIQYLQQVRDGVVYGSRVSARVLLVNLNDQEHIQNVLKDFESRIPKEYGRAAGIFNKSSQIEVIPLFAQEYVFREEPTLWREFKYQGHILYDQSILSGQIVLAILSRSPDVPADVQAWAKKNRLASGGRAKHCRTVVRQWWPENKRYFETKEYDKLRPLGAEHPPEEPVEPLQTDKEPGKEIIPAAESKTYKAVMPAATHRQVIDKPKPAKLEILEESEPLNESSNPWKLIVSIVGILTVGALVFFKYWK